MSPALTPERIDQLIDEHFRYEATDDVDAVVASLTPDAAHHVVPSPVGPIRGRDAARAFYRRLFDALAGEQVTPVRRLYGSDFVVDEVLWQGRVIDGSIFLCDGRTRCSQMTSCSEATGFLRNCPNSQMDGDGDGVPCERQWCGGR